MLSEELHRALNEDVEDDIAKSLYSLIKYNDGLWKSDRQARYLLPTIRMLRNARAQQWADRAGFKGTAIAWMKRIEGFGRKTVSKIRYSATLFVVDDGGVVMSGRPKVNHVKNDEGNFDIDYDHVDIKWKREKEPTIKVDIDAEKREQVKKNQPTIAMIKSIPDWEDKDILQSFMDQLLAGKPLSPKQQMIVQKMSPEPEAMLGGKESWQEAWDNYKQLLINMLRVMKVDHVRAEVALNRKYAAHLAAVARAKEDGKHEPYWHMREPDPPREVAKEFDRVMKQVKAKGHATLPGDANNWIDHALANALGRLSRHMRLHGGFVQETVEFAKQFQKAMKAKKPTKKALGFILFIKTVGEKKDNIGAIKKSLK